ncbi:MAG: NAD(P)-dependent oxidoreductase [Candidatus Hodarchaeales archaeon]|jgi:phosphoglycerate dehydrogenase-like enzyme
MKVVFTYYTSPEFREHVTKHVLPEIELVFLDELDDDTVAENCKVADMIVSYQFSDRLLSTTEAKFLHIPWTGTNTVDFAPLLSSSSPFILLNSHDNARTIAEHALTLLLTTARKIIPSDRLLRSADWSSRLDRSSPLLTNKTFLFLGYGHIARELIKLLSGFNPDVLVIRNSSTQAGSYETFQVKDLHSVLPRADFVVIALPLTPETKGIIGEREFKLMKASVFLVNIARGDIIVEEALYNALKDGEIAGAGLDVWWQYPEKKITIDGKREFKKVYPSRFPSLCLA